MLTGRFVNAKHRSSIVPVENESTQHSLQLLQKMDNGRLEKSKDRSL